MPLKQVASWHALDLTQHLAQWSAFEADSGR
jgi:hypothetical protein